MLIMMFFAGEGRDCADDEESAGRTDCQEEFGETIGGVGYLFVVVYLRV